MVWVLVRLQELLAVRAWDRLWLVMKGCWANGVDRHAVRSVRELTYALHEVWEVLASSWVNGPTQVLRAHHDHLIHLRDH